MMGLLLFPFKVVWSLIGLAFNLTGRLLGVIIGLVLMVAGVILTFTVVGAIIGVPLLILGLLLTARSLFN